MKMSYEKDIIRRFADDNSFQAEEYFLKMQGHYMEILSEILL